MTSTACDSVRIRYKGNGAQKQFTFPFTYMHWYDVTAAIWDETKKEYVDQKNKFVFANATTIEFLSAPPAPLDPTRFNIIIGRATSLEQMIATFYPGSSIRAEDLNDDFDQLRLAIQEGRCSIEAKLSDLQTEFWGKKSIRSRVDYSKPEPPFDVIYRRDQEEGYWRPDGDQEAVATTGAIAARHDNIVQDNVPVNPVQQQKGKKWINTVDCWEGYWEPQADAWVAYVNTGPRGEQGPEGPQGAKGDPGPPLSIKGYMNAGVWVEPDPKSAGDLYIATGTITSFPGGGSPVQGDGLMWSGAYWYNIGRIQGPVGPAGPQGIQGIQGLKGDQGDKGDKGDQGIQGVIGLTGPQGIQGVKGDKGDTGPTGPQGIQGIQGIVGPQGPKGDKGDTGATGPSGVGINYKGSVANEAGLSAISNPSPNDGYLALDTGNVHVWTGSAWLNIGLLTGPQGAQGLKGDTGDQGIQGIQGQTGATGPAGPTGPQGVKGDKGDRGDQGIQGVQGVLGPVGPAGPLFNIALLPSLP